MGTAFDFVMGKDSKERNYDDKLPDGDKYFGLVNVQKFSLKLIGLQYLLCQFSHLNIVSL